MMHSTTDERPLISVVLATFNGARFLAIQLDSVFEQTYPNIEVVAVDDCSTDDTFFILEQYAQRHPNMKIARNPQNLGFAKNFERACSLATGTLIALCDQDDIWLPQKLEQLQAAMGKSALIHCNSALCNENGELIGVLASDRAVFKPINNCLEQAVFCRIYGHASLITRPLMEKAIPFLPRLPHDWWLCFIATFSGGIQYLPETLVYYRQHSQNTIGAVGGKSRKTGLAGPNKKNKEQELTDIRNRMAAFYAIGPESLAYEKGVLKALNKSYESFSLTNNFRRMVLFLRLRHTLLSVKKRSDLRKFLFCIKMFWTIK
jgi:glycosyltransferase involved in cell wall biosynthesis